MMTSQRPFRVPEHQVFDYTALDSETRIVVQQQTSEIKECLKTAARSVWEIGQKLVEVRTQLEYGQFRDWLKAEFRWSRSKAYNYINVFETFGSCPNFGQVDIAISALYLLAAPSTPEEVRQEMLERAVQGEAITHKAVKELLFQQTIDVVAKTVEEKSPALTEVPPVPEPQFQSELVPELFSPSLEPEAQPENLIDVTLQVSESHQALEELESSAQTELAPATGFKVDDRIHVEGSQNKHVNGKTKNIARANSMHKTVAALVDGSLPWNTVSLPIQRCTKVDVQAQAPTSFQFEVGDRIHILRHQHGEGSWAGKTARIWQVTPDGHLRVDVEGHPEVRFSLHPDSVERIPEEIPEQHNEQLEQVLSPSWADEQDPEPPTVTDIPSLVQREGEAAPHFQPGDRVFLGDPNQQGQRWMGEVAEVLEAAEDCIKLIVELRPSGQTAVTTF